MVSALANPTHQHMYLRFRSMQMLQSASASVILSTDKDAPCCHFSHLKEISTFLLWRGSTLRTFPLPAWPLMSAGRAACVERSAARRGLDVHHALNSPEKRWLAFAVERRVLNEGRRRRWMEKKITSLNRVAGGGGEGEGGEKRGWFLIPSLYCCLSGPDFPSFFSRCS